MNKILSVVIAYFCFSIFVVAASGVTTALGKIDVNAPCTITSGYFDNDQYPDYILENGLIKATFSSGKGGKCISLIYKPAQAELVVNRDDDTTGAVFELFWIQETDEAAKKVNIGRINAGLFQYNSRISGRGDNDVRVEFRIEPRFEGLNGWSFKRSVSLKRGSPTLQMICSAGSLGKDDAIKAGVWFRNCLWVKKEFVDPHRVAMMVGKELKVYTCPGNAPLDWPSQDVTYPYTGIYGTQSKVGVIMKIDTPEELSCQYSWCSPKGLITLEWMTHQNEYAGHWKNPKKTGPVWYWKLTAFDKDSYKNLPSDYHPICAALIDPEKAVEIKPVISTKSPLTNAPFLLFSKTYSSTIKDLLQANKVSKLNEETFTIYSDITPPHQVWGKPLADGALKVIFMSSGVLDIADRLDLDYTYLPPIEQAKGGPLHPDVENRLSKALDGKWEVIVLGGTPWDKLGKEVRAKILEGVKAGRGLVCVDSVARGDLAELAGKNRLTEEADIMGRLAALSTFRKISAVPNPEEDHYGKIIKLAQVGEGRIAIINNNAAYFPSLYRPLSITGEPFTWRLWEYDYALVAKAMLWAGRGLASARLIQASVSALDKSPQLEADVKGKGGERLQVTIRDWDTRQEYQAESTAVKDNKAGLTLPVLKSGNHIAELILKNSKGKVTDWGAVVFIVPDKGIKIALALDKPFYRLGDTIQAKVTVTGNTEKIQNQIRLRVMNSEERVFYQHKTNANEAAEFSIPTRDFPFYRAYLEAALEGESASGTLDEARQIVNILHPEEQDFVLDAWGAGSVRGYGALWHNLLARKLGFTHLQATRFFNRQQEFMSCCDAIMAGNMRLSYYGAACNLHDEKGNSYPYGPLMPPGRGNACVVGPDRIRKPCLTSPEFWRLFETNINEYAPLLTGLGVVHNYMQDEGALDQWGFGEPYHDLCLSPTCLDAFRTFLKTEYSTLADLNKDWGANYGKWEEVIPATYLEIKGKKVLAPWMLNRRFRDSIWAGSIERMGKMFAGFAPGIKTGLSGTSGLSPYDNRDFSSYIPVMQASQRYSGAEIIRSFKKPGTVIGRWAGYDVWNRDELVHRFQAWDSFIQGENGINFYAYKQHLPGGYGIFWPRYHVRGAGIWSLDVVRELSRGLTRIMLKSKRQENKIAIIYSPRSIHTSYGLFGLEWKLDPRSVSGGLGQILTDLGYQYHYVSSEEIAQGELLKGGYLVVIAGNDYCLLNKEVEAIRDFVKNGGLLLACVRPAVTSQSGNLLDHGQLDDVFGIKAGQMSLADTMVEIDDLKVPLCEEGIQTNGAEALYRDKSGKLISFINNFMKGRAVLLNFATRDYAKTISGGVAGEEETYAQGQEKMKKAMRSLFRDVFYKQGIVPAMTVKEEGAEEPHLAGVEAVIYDAGNGIKLVGLLKKPYTTGPAFRKELQHAVTITLPQEAHVYDSRRGKYLGLTRTVQTKIDTGVGEIYALLPYKAKALKIDLPEKAKGGQVVAGNIVLEVESGKPGDHVFHIRVLEPSGEEFVLYRRNLDAPGGKAELRLLLPFDAASGKWMVVVREALAGLEIKQSLQVSAPE